MAMTRFGFHCGCLAMGFFAARRPSVSISAAASAVGCDFAAKVGAAASTVMPRKRAAVLVALVAALAEKTESVDFIVFDPVLIPCWLRTDEAGRSMPRI